MFWRRIILGENGARMGAMRRGCACCEVLAGVPVGVSAGVSAESMMFSGTVLSDLRRVLLVSSWEMKRETWTSRVKKAICVGCPSLKA